MRGLLGIAWDDRRIDMEALKRPLKRFGIGLEIYDRQSDFLDAFGVSRPDFVVIDLFDETTQVGDRLAKQIDTQTSDDTSYPIFVLTRAVQNVDPEELNLPSKSVFCLKGDPDWLALYMKEELVRRGLYVNARKVFLVSCRQRTTYTLGAARVKMRLLRRKIEVVEAQASNLHVEIAAGLVQKMNACKAIVAVCTPDDARADGTRQPRQNVLLEIGVAMGLSRGLRRLVIVQKRGETKEQYADLPSDLGGVLTVSYEDSIDECLDDLETKLTELGIDLE
jgi:predicted nucleotide-binding protein